MGQWAMWFSCVYFYSVHLGRNYYSHLGMALVEEPHTFQALWAPEVPKAGAVFVLWTPRV